jgi:catechol 2,3-dioxygenase-like lactoylglutathione lyase family enzyme
MNASLDHTIVWSRDPKAAATFLAEILDLAPPTFGYFAGVRLGNGVTLDYLETTREIAPQHYAFLISESAFDAALARLVARKIRYWADPMHRQEGAIDTRDGGRGLYFEDPSGHNLEILTRPYGSG